MAGPPLPAPVSSREADPEARRRLLVQTGVVLALCVVPGVVESLLGLAEGGPRVHGRVQPFADALRLLVYQGAAAAVLLYLLWRDREPIEPRAPLRAWLASSFVGGGVLWALQIGLYFLLAETYPGREEALAIAPAPPAQGGALVVAVSVAADLVNAFAEELAMRRVLVDRLERLTGKPGLAVLLSALGFAAYHLYQGVFYATSALVMGLLFGLAFVLTRRLAPLVVAHVLLNLVRLWG
jgi:membrane protease YdiL (CAAX protease family)